MEKIGASIKGIYRDILKDRDNNIIFDSGWTSNLIVEGCRTLLAALMKNNTTGGLKCLRVGEGNPQWDNLEIYPTGPPPPEPSAAGLEGENLFPIDVGDLVLAYLNKSNAEVTLPTNRLQVTATLGANQPPPLGEEVSSYPLREFGLFGVYIDDDEVEHEYMIDCIRHPVINKDENSTLIRVVRLYF